MKTTIPLSGFEYSLQKIFRKEISPQLYEMLRERFSLNSGRTNLNALDRIFFAIRHKISEMAYPKQEKQ